MWSKSCCAPNNKGEAFTCVRQSAMKWMCQLESLVASSAFAKTVRKASTRSVFFRLPVAKSFLEQSQEAAPDDLCLQQAPVDSTCF